MDISLHTTYSSEDLPRMAAHRSSSKAFRLIPAASKTITTFRSSSSSNGSISSLLRGDGLSRVRLFPFRWSIKITNRVMVLTTASTCWYPQGPAFGWGLGGSRGAASAAACSPSDPAQLRSARDDIRELLKTTFCHPILVRFAVSRILYTQMLCLSHHRCW